MQRCTSLLLLAVVSTCVTQVTSSSSSSSQRKNAHPPHYVIDLDAAPEQRWSKVVAAHQQYVDAVQDMARQWVPKVFQSIAWEAGTALSYLLPEEYRREMNGIAQQSGIPYGLLVWINILYDISAFDRSHIIKACTSIVAQDKRGVVWHGRNLDFEMEHLIRNLTVFVSFTRNGTVIAQSPTFAYFVGTITGQRNGQYSVSLNERYSGPLVDNILMALYTRMHHPASFLMRDTLLNIADYSEAVRALSESKMIAPCYYIVAGSKPNQGVIITRDRWRAADVWTIDVPHNKWYELETNFDHGRQPPESDHRRAEAQRMMNATGQARIGPKTMYRLLSTQPVNNRLTIFTTVMCPARPELMYSYTFVRREHDDDDPDRA